MSIQEAIITTVKRKGPRIYRGVQANPHAVQAKLPMVEAKLPIQDERHTATATCNSREDMMCQLLNQEVQDSALSVFPCTSSVLRNFRTSVLNKCVGFRQAVRAGGLNAHYDLDIQTETKNIHTELKVTKHNASSLDVLRWTPWVDTVQFLQGQLTSSVGRRFLGECGEPMIHAWFHEVVLPFSSKIPEATGMTVEGYQKAMSTINMVGKQEDASKAFILALRTHKSLQKELQHLWLDFEVRWLSSHRLNDAGLEEVIREIIESKDAWICVAKNQVQWIDGLRVLRLESAGVAPKKKGGMLFRYLLTLQSGEEIKIVPIECKFHWKNGGQAVQNINFLLL